MNKINYHNKMKEQIKALQGKPRLLLHCCCAPCASHCLSVLKDFFDVTVYFYNPNIDDEEENEKRRRELARFVLQTGWADFLDAEEKTEEFYTAVKGFETEREGGARCKRCFDLRLERTALAAKQNGFDFFATTLTVSPLKNAQLLNTIGEKQGEIHDVRWLYSDFKKQGGYLHSVELSAKYGLYRQNYCGCSFSKQKNG